MGKSVMVAVIGIRDVLRSHLRRIVERQRCGLFDFLHGEARAYDLQIDLIDQSFVEFDIGRDVRHHDPQQVIHITAHPVKLHNLGGR